MHSNPWKKRPAAGAACPAGGQSDQTSMPSPSSGPHSASQSGSQRGPRPRTAPWTRALSSLGLGVLLFLVLGAPMCPSPGPGPDGGAASDGGRIVDAAPAADLRGTRDLAAPHDAGSADLLARKNSGDCDTDRDCAGGRCVELSPGGYRVCAQPVTEATSCPGRGPDACCKTADCTTGACYEWPLSPYCGGAFPVPHNVCAEEGCATLADCGAGAVCVPKGALGYKVRACLPARCLRDSDCTAAAGGTCAPIRKPCCSGTYGLYCVYPGGCRSSADCAGGYCDVTGDTTKCQTGVPPCPP